MSVEVKKYLLLSSLIILSVTAKANGSDTMSSGKDFKSLIGERPLPTSYDSLAPAMFKLNNKMQGFVSDYIARNAKELEKMKEWGKPYFQMYDKVLRDYGIPTEMKYLSVIESHLRSSLRSHAGAVGPWQLMSYEGQRFGLKMTQGSDERTDFYKSTVVAAQLLKELYNQFDNWLLVLAAYNGGPGRLKQAIQKAGGSRDFWDLEYYLPQETRNHVKKFIATHYMFEGGGGWTTMTPEETETFKKNIPVLLKPEPIPHELLDNTSVVNVSGRYNSLIISSALMLDINLFNKLNPGFDKAISEGKQYSLRLPNEKVPLFEAKKIDILRQSVHLLLTQSAT